MTNSSSGGGHNALSLKREDIARDLGYVGTAKGWIPVEDAPEGNRGLTRGQWRRWSYVTLEGTLALPRATLQAWEVAIRLGKILRTDKTFDRIRNQDEALCVEVRPSHRDKVLALLDVKPRAWRKYIGLWEQAHMAHRCEELPPGSVRLFFKPEETCPVCGEALSAARPVPPERPATYRPPARPVPRFVPDTGNAPRSGKGTVLKTTIEEEQKETSLTSLEQVVVKIERAFGSVEVVEGVDGAA